MIEAETIYGKSIEKFSENFNRDTDNMKRLPEDQQKYEKSRQKAKWEVNDKKNLMIRKQVEKELILYESFRDCLGRFSLRTTKTRSRDCDLILIVNDKRFLRKEYIK